MTAGRLSKVVADVHETADRGDFKRGIQVAPELLVKIAQLRKIIQQKIASLETGVMMVELDEEIHPDAKLKKGETELLKKIRGLPRESRIILLGDLGKTDEETRKLGRHLLANSVIDPDGSEVWNSIQDIAKTIAVWLKEGDFGESDEFDEDFLAPLILANGILNTRALNKKRILKIPYVNGYISTSQFFEGYKRANAVRSDIAPGKHITDEAQDLALLRALGAEIHRIDEKNVQRSLEVNKTKAISWLKTILSQATEIMKAELPEETIDVIDLDNDLEGMGIAGLAQTMFDRSQKPDKREEAQILLRMVFEMINIRGSDAYAATSIFKKNAQKDLTELFEPNAFEKIDLDELEFNENGEIVNVKPARIRKDARIIHLNLGEGESKKTEKVRVLWTPFDEKGADPILIKMMTRESSQEADEVRDHLRSALEFPDITIHDLTHVPEKKKIMEETLIQAGMKLGMTYVPYEETDDFKNLKPGQFTVEDCTGEDKGLFRNMKLVGILADTEDPTRIGTTIEIQANPGDLNRIVEGKNSPFAHPEYDKLRKAETAKNILSRSRRPQAHRALNKYITRAKARRKTASKSAEEWINQNNGSHSASPAQQEVLA